MPNFLDALTDEAKHPVLPVVVNTHRFELMEMSDYKYIRKIDVKTTKTQATEDNSTTTGTLIPSSDTKEQNFSNKNQLVAQLEKNIKCEGSCKGSVNKSRLLIGSMFVLDIDMMLINNNIDISVELPTLHCLFSYISPIVVLIILHHLYKRKSRASFFTA